MREILFRGKRLSDGGWSYGNLRIANTGVTIIVPNDTPLGKYGKVDPETVCQYTGLTDKNGVKIFEGDIIKHFNCFDKPDHYEVYRIDFNERICRFEGRLHEQWAAQLREDLRYEVIGNVFDNPELMEGGEADETC